MKRRLFALLLAVVMMLGLSAPVFGEGEDDPAQSSVPMETEGEVKTEDETKTEGETNDEQTGEPQPLAAGTLKVTFINQAGALGDGFNLTSADGSTTLTSGTTADLPLEIGGGVKLLIPGEIPAHCCLWVEDAANDTCSLGDGDVSLVDGNGDGQVTLVLEEDPHLEVTVVDNTGRGLTVTQADGTAFTDGDHVYRNGDGDYALKVSPASADLVVRTLTENGVNDVPFHIDPATGIIAPIEDFDQDGKLTVQLDVLPSVTVKIVNDPGVTLKLTQEDGTPVEDGSKVYAPSIYQSNFELQASLDSAYTLVNGGDGNDWVYFYPNGYNGGLRFGSVSLYDGNSDGAVTIQVAARPTAALAVNGPADKVTFEQNGAPVKVGDTIYTDEDLYATTASGYGIPDDDFYNSYLGPDGRYCIDGYEMTGTFTVYVMPIVTLHMEGAGLKYVSPDASSSSALAEGDPM